MSEGLTVMQINALLTKPKKVEAKAKAKAKASAKVGQSILVRTTEGRLARINVDGAKTARFKGKQGTLRRNAKGRTTIKPDGWRRIQHDWATDGEIIGYRVG